MTEGNSLFLARPSITYQVSYLAALREFHREGRNLGWDYEDVSGNFERFVRELRNRLDYAPLGKVRETILWLIHKDIFVGRLSLRHELTPNLLQFGGHIGYEIRPSMRRKGYGTAILRLGLQEAKKIGLKRVLVTCDDINIASAKIIEANGGVLENIVLLAGHDVATKRYWIGLK